MTSLRTIFTRTRGSVTTISSRHPTAAITTTRAARTLHQSAAARQPYKDDMDRESLKPKAHENTQSGTDDQVAQEDEAFDPHKTDPDSERASAASKRSNGSNSSPLEGTPANRDVAARQTGAQEDHAPGGSGDSSKPSAKGNAPKKGKV